MRIEVSRGIEAGAEAVWAVLADIAGHVTWMADAASIRFVGDRRTGVGTRFECVTRVGPLRMVDIMEVTGWEEGREIAVHHGGVVTGDGRFVIEPDEPAGRTVVRWTEELHFRWYVGGPVAGFLARPVLRRIWRSNLRHLAALLEG